MIVKENNEKKKHMSSIIQGACMYVKLLMK